MRTGIVTFLSLICLIVAGCSHPPPIHEEPSPDFAKINEPLDVLLKRYVKNGLVDYSAWKNNPEDVQSLENYLASLADIHADNLDSYGDRKIFWINAYNAFGIKLVLERYPIKSVVFDEKTNNDPRIKDFMSGPDRKIGTVIVSLDDIEQERIDTRNNPLLHFALVKPALGSPDLQSSIYQGKDLNNQMDTVVRAFLSNETKGMRLDPANKKIYLSTIFKQYRLEFGDLTAFIRPYISIDRQIKLDEMKAGKIDIEYLDFDWRLNDSRPDMKTTTPVRSLKVK